MFTNLSAPQSLNSGMGGNYSLNGQMSTGPQMQFTGPGMNGINNGNPMQGAANYGGQTNQQQPQNWADVIQQFSKQMSQGINPKSQMGGMQGMQGQLNQGIQPVQGAPMMQIPGMGQQQAPPPPFLPGLKPISMMGRY